MPAYSSTPLWKKLGYKNDMTAAVIAAPSNYRTLLQLPAEIQIRWLPLPRSGMTLVHLFCRDTATLKKKLAPLRNQIAPDGIIWVSWPKKASGVETDITDNAVRSVALPLGLVDIKVCSVDDVWSGLKLMVRKSER